MPVILISAEVFEEGRDIAERVAAAMGYSYLDRELLDEVADKHGANREHLVRALDEAPGFFTRRGRQKRLLPFIEAACTEKLRQDNVVCHGLAAHLYVRGVSHVLKVRITSDSGDRQQGQGQAGDEERARQLKEKRRLQQKERNWSMDAYGLDATDASLYDLVIGLGTVEREKAVEVICDMAGYRKFQPMTYSKKCMEDKALAAKVRERLVERFPDVRVEASAGVVVVHLAALKKDQRKKQEHVRRLATDINGVRHLEVHVIRDYFGQAAQSFR